MSLKKNQYLKQIYSKNNIFTILKYMVVILASICYLDIYDIPSVVMDKIGFKVSILFGVLTLGMIIILLYEKHVHDWEKIISINICDRLYQAVIIAILVYVFLIYAFEMEKVYKIVVSAIIIMICGYYITMRNRNYNLAKKESQQYVTNIVDLKDLYDNKISKCSDLILLDERDVDYDLLDRRSIINNLANIIIKSKPQGKFVISLEGRWGTGKTTILKNVKKIINETDNNIVVIDDFDPWTYGSEESIVENFFQCVLRQNDLKINSSEIRHSISVLANAVIDYPERINLVTAIFCRNKDVQESKKEINEYLKLCGKRIVMYIDNLDRVDDDKIIFIFKLIGNVLDFERVTYVISFDDEKVQRIFNDNLNIDYDYIKKIVQLQIKVPEVDSSVIQNVAKKCSSNLISLYVNSDKEKQEYDDTISYIVKYIEDIRDYKRFANSVLMPAISNENTLSKRDKLIIQYIRMNNFELYKDIYNHRKYFISEDLRYDEDLYMTIFSKDKFNSDAGDFFKSLFAKEVNKKYIELLCMLFPYISRYSKEQDIRSDYVYDKQTERERIEKTRGIASAKYFNLYFSDTENEFSVLGKFIKGFIENINKNNENIDHNVYSVLNDIPRVLHKEFTEEIQLYINDINQTSVYSFLHALFMNSWQFSNSSGFAELSARRRCEVIMWMLLQRLSDSEYENFLREIQNQYDKIEIINGITYWFQNDNESKNKEGRLKLWQANEENIISNIISQDIDIYSDQYYHYQNAWALCRNLKNSLDIFQAYISKRINRKNIFRILYDVLGHMIGNGHQYYIVPKNLKLFFNEEELMKYMEKVDPVTEDEKLLMYLYKQYLLYPNDDMGDRTGITLNEEKEWKF